MSRQLSCRDVYKIVTWSKHYISDKNNTILINFQLCAKKRGMSAWSQRSHDPTLWRPKPLLAASPTPPGGDHTWCDPRSSFDRGPPCESEAPRYPGHPECYCKRGTVIRGLGLRDTLLRSGHFIPRFADKENVPLNVASKFNHVQGNILWHTNVRPARHPAESKICKKQNKTKNTNQLNKNTFKKTGEKVTTKHKTLKRKNNIIRM